MPPYSYNTFYPRGEMSDSQPEMLQNFTAIPVLIDVNHEDFTSADAGKHTFLTFTQQTSDPVINTSGNPEVAVFSKLNALNLAALFFKRQNNTTLYDFTTSSQTATGWMRLPSGILLKWGYTPATGTGSGPNSNYYAITYTNFTNDTPFKTQYWAIVVNNTKPGGGLVPRVFYVTNLSDPRQIVFAIWKSGTITNAPATSIDNISLSYFAIGI